MKEKILVVDDEEEIVSFIKDYLLLNEYEVITAFNGEEAIRKIELNPDLILLDIMMPGIDGFNVCKEIRDKINCPIIFLTAKNLEDDKIKGLLIGGDDYIVKPFSLKELKARIISHIRRDKRLNDFKNNNKTKFGDLYIDIKGRQVYYKDETIPMTKREFDIIEFLSLNSGQVFSREYIYEKIWGYDGEGDTSTITEHVKKIRAKFSNISKELDYIKTVWGIGYKWEK
ncbi:DNA-binding response OmpR family regulator [Clostridium tetanomorphum]|uniref:response regulator transcription factor n=1 Tax=Clostridium tetanomorphum TaxID=1553 RepID=UPI00044C056C|nr:response regulator transcription factor [Clostridium tetanomorphum]KAJ51985.1 Response regulator [Clostridium tetanomorphum DSM 665]MBP1862905.1 DNA-binding response OmpR family regulator [Clostridium tetanomorphum]NRS87042.1 DNA-binding response OmpR family regulator [Clostridium tetanomorphum]SQC00152.1 two-component response regulator [Clostridium tetanomorphum]